MRFRLYQLVALAICSVSAIHVSAAPEDSLEQAFRDPPAVARPLVYWFWMGRNVTREGITRDLESLQAAGFGGATMCNLSDTCTPWSGVIADSPLPEIVPYVSDEWWELLHHAASECERLGLEFGFHNCPGYESSGGPWITPELSMQELCFSATPLEGAGRKSVPLPKPHVDPRGVMEHPILNEDNGQVEKPVHPARQTYYRDVAVLALPAEGTVPAAEVVDVSAQMSPEGMLTWDAPPGRWVIYRFGHTTRGTRLQPAPWKAAGLECDKMNPAAVKFHMNHVLNKLKQHCADDIGKGLDYLWFDSYEAGAPNWTPRMREEFLSRRGYDSTPFLATFAGRVIGDDAASKKFSADFRRTIADLYRDVNFTINKQLANAAGLEVRSEPYGGPWVVSEVIPLFDECAGEFWFRDNKYQPWLLQEVIDGCRKAGRNIVCAEAFTSAPTDCQWNETPAVLKPVGDAAFCDGVNRLMLHRFTHQPFSDKFKPGMTMGQWGTHFDRTQTWWEPARAWVAYLTRCQALLQWGAPVAIEPADFQVEGAAPDAIKAIHRREGQIDAYFVANLSRQRQAARCSFAVSGRIPELWDPVTGETRELSNFPASAGSTTLALEFAEAQSWFVVFRKSSPTASDSQRSASHPQESPATSASGERQLVEIKGPWQVRFARDLGGPEEPGEFAALLDWTKHPVPGVRYYSGTAVYKTTFPGPARSGTRVFLDLGVVHDIARVRLNGVDLGVIWTAPWRVALPDSALKADSNQLEIEITNCWANRLIGDEQQPPDCEWTPGHHGNGGYLTRFPEWFVQDLPRPSPGRVTFSTWNYFTKDSPLLPAGLIGPVRLLAEEPN